MVLAWHCPYSLPVHMVKNQISFRRSAVTRYYDFELNVNICDTGNNLKFYGISSEVIEIYKNCFFKSNKSNNYI